MLAARYAGEGTMRVDEVTASPPGPGEVRISVAYTGICGTDLHILHGAMDARVDVPMVIGHEMAGVIDAVGDDVDGWSAGDAVTVMPLHWDGTCPACRAGNQHICQNLDFIGIDSPGALQPLWNVPADTLVRLPSELALDHAALVEPTAVAVHDVRRSELTVGDRVVVIGGGPIGLLIALTARESGGDVLVVELDPRRRDAVAGYGFATSEPSEVSARVEEWTAGAGADVVFEVSGAAAAIAVATGLAKVRGTIVVVAIHPTPREVDLQRVFWRELRILGARVYQRTDFERAVELLASGVIPAASLITGVYPLERVSEAFEALSTGREMKVLVDCRPEAS